MRQIWPSYGALRVFSHSHRRLKWTSKAQIRPCSCSKAPRQLLNTTTSNLPKPATDHRVLGTSLDLFITHPSSPGSPLFLPAGAHVFHKLQSFLRAQYAAFGFKEVVTPTIYKKHLWQQSGHWDNYKDDMFDVRGRGASGETEDGQIGENEEYGLKPMNCPGHCLLFKARPRSYRDLPIRYADFSPLHRNEMSGALSGLTRVRRFHQDDGHIFCQPSQVREEIEKTLEFVGMVYETFELGSYKLVLSTRPSHSFIGRIEEWDRAEEQLREALDRSGKDWELQEGDGAFYGPKIDIILQDSDGKEHQTATIQLDFQLPQRFELEYQASEEARKEVPVIIHRAILGSLERFMALLIEHYNGHWPFWLSPRQAIILAVDDSDEVISAVREAAEKLRTPGNAQDMPRSRHIRKPRPLETPTFLIDTDCTSRSVAKKVAEAKRKKYNFVALLGKRNLGTGTLDLDITGHRNSVMAEGIASYPLLEELTRADPIDEKAPFRISNPRAVSCSVDQFSDLMLRLNAKYL